MPKSAWLVSYKHPQTRKKPNNMGACMSAMLDTSVRDIGCGWQMANGKFK